jgi:hypothetical protein
MIIRHPSGYTLSQVDRESKIKVIYKGKPCEPVLGRVLTPDNAKAIILSLGR